MNEENQRMNTISPVTKPWGKTFPIPKPPSSPVLAEDIKISSIGHAFGQLPTELSHGRPPLYFVHDFLLDQSQSTGGGSALVDPLQFDLNNSAGYKYILQAASDRTFQIDLPTGVSNIYFSAGLGRRVITGLSGGVFTGTSANIAFGNLAGMSPHITYNNFSITQNNNEAILFEIEGALTSNLGFKSITIQGHYAHRTFDPGEKSYDPLSYAVPFGTKSIYPKSETFVLFGYHTPHGVDPGRFVRIV
jgi:hypothetical protein